MFDAVGDQLWTQQRVVYDEQTRINLVGVIYDDGHVETAVYDSKNDQPWTSQSAVYNPDGQVIAMSVTYDDGHVDNWHI